MRFVVRFDMRAPDFGVSPARLYGAAGDIAQYVDENGFDSLYLAEHHGSTDGYNPSSRVLAGALAARTKAIEIRLSALIVPFHHPIELAEDLAVLDLLSNGRLAVTLGLGHRPAEFAMFGVERSTRGKRVDEAVDVFQKAWTGEPFEFRGETVLVRPAPARPGGPTLYMGGTTEASAKRAARLGIGFDPGPNYAEPTKLWSVYKAALAERGMPDPGPGTIPGPRLLYVTRDPERDWARVERHIAHHFEMYNSWRAASEEAGTKPKGDYSPYSDAASARTERITDAYAVVSPEECLELARRLGPHGEMVFHPLMSGLDPELAWASLRCFVDDVLPAIRADANLR